MVVALSTVTGDFTTAAAVVGAAGAVDSGGRSGTPGTAPDGPAAAGCAPAALAGVPGLGGRGGEGVDAEPAERDHGHGHESHGRPPGRASGAAGLGVRPRWPLAPGL